MTLRFKWNVYHVLIALTLLWWAINVYRQFQGLSGPQTSCFDDSFCSWASTRHGAFIIATEFTVYTAPILWILALPFILVKKHPDRKLIIILVAAAFWLFGLALPLAAIILSNP
jgi:hypothetical protein